MRKQPKYTTKKIAIIGVNAVENIVVNHLNWIFRRLDSETDFGIDAHIELVKDDNPEGKLLGLQIKTGKSQFHESRDGVGLVFYFDEDHYNYWITYSLPCLIVGHLPKKQKTYWQHLCERNIEKTDKGYKIKIPFLNELNGSCGRKIRKIVQDHNKSNLMRNENIEELEKLIKNEDPENDKQIIEIIKKIGASNQPINNIEEGLNLLSKNLKDEEQIKVLNQIISDFKRREIIIRYKKDQEPDLRALNAYKDLLNTLQVDESIDIKNKCRLYAGLIYLLKPFLLNDNKKISKIRSLGITEEIEKKIKDELLKAKLINKVNDILIFSDQKLGRYVVQDVFLGKGRLIDFNTVKGMFV